MADFVTKGFSKGHVPTQGFYSEVEITDIEAILNEFDSDVGVSPLIRIRFDLDGDDIYETVEQGAQVLKISDINKVIEYLTNKSRYGSCTLALNNYDNRWSDFFSKSFTYAVGPGRKRYHYRKAIVELGFDNLAKKNNSGWYPLFFGYINVKQENADSQSVSITLLDEWNRIFNSPLYTTAIAHDYLTYVNTNIEDWRELDLGTFYGKHHFLFAERNSKTNQVMIPCVHNLDDISVVTNRGTFTAMRYFAFKAQAFLPSALASELSTRWYSDVSKPDIDFPQDYNQVYVWGWNKDWFLDGKAQWIRIPKIARTNSNVIVEQYLISSVDGITGYFQQPQYLIFYDASGNRYEKSWVDIFDETNSSFEWIVKLHCELTYNPAKILYKLLTDYLGISSPDIDVSSDDTDNWEEQEYDFDNPSYRSFDTSAFYLENQEAKISINIKTETTFQDVVEKICELSRGSLFIDRGKAVTSTEYIPLRRIKFVIHQPRAFSPTVQVLDSKKILNPTLSRDVTDIKNKVTVEYCSFDTTVNYSNRLTTLNIDQDSINVYGIKEYTIRARMSDIMFLYDSEYYANFLGSHYVYIFKEPPVRLDLSTQLIGYRWDLKSLLGIRELTSLLIDFDLNTNNLTGLFEVYEQRMNTNNFRFSLSLKWAGFLLAPDGEIATKRWAFWDNFYYGGKDGVKYYGW